MNIAKIDALSTFQQIERPKDLQDLLRSLRLFAPMLQTLTNVVFFVKNTQAEYCFANETLLCRLQLSAQELEGKTSESVFSSEWGKIYTQQDETVLSTGKSIVNQLELHIYTSGELGWCITNKMPIYDVNNHIIAMMGASIDIDTNNHNKPALNKKIILINQYIQNNLENIIKMQDLECVSGLSTAQIERSFKKLFGITPSQYIQKKRIERAIDLLGKHYSITDISNRCGYSDHSAFTRQFKQVLGVSPSDFKARQAVLNVSCDAD